MGGGLIVQPIELVITGLHLLTCVDAGYFANFVCANLYPLGLYSMCTDCTWRACL